MKIFSLLCFIFILNSELIGANYFPQTKFEDPRNIGPGKVGRSDSGIDYPPYETIVQKMISLTGNNTEYSKLINIGLSEDKVNTYGILISNKKIKIKNLILITGATHGNEFLNIANKLPEAFLDQRNKSFYSFYNRGGAFFIIPIVNPYGYSNRVRYNINGVDLNRDFTNVITNVVRFTQKETQNYANFLEDFLKQTNANLNISVDYHCCYAGALLYPWSYTNTPIPTNDRFLFEEIGGHLKSNFPYADVGPVSDILWYSPDGTSLDYLYAKYNTLAMAYEGRYKTEENYIDSHINFWKDLVENFK
jgi:succinylglutamate desuccinylase